MSNAAAMTCELTSAKLMMYRLIFAVIFLWELSLPCCALSSQTAFVRLGLQFGRPPSPKAIPDRSVGISNHATLNVKSEVHRLHTRQQSTLLHMGLLENISSFLGKREGDFVKLDTTDDAFGPGPVILLYGCPTGLGHQELKDMISDGAPKATKVSGGVPFCRIEKRKGEEQKILEASVLEALELVISGEHNEDNEATEVIQPISCPVIYFSGFTNAEMMETYGIIAKEIYEETGGVARAACAKAVPPAMNKKLGQVFDEITGDHMDAIADVSGQGDN